MHVTLCKTSCPLLKNEFRAFLQEDFIKRVLEWFDSNWLKSQFCSQGVRWDLVGFWDDSYLVIKMSVLSCVQTSQTTFWRNTVLYKPFHPSETKSWHLISPLIIVSMMKLFLNDNLYRSLPILTLIMQMILYQVSVFMTAIFLIQSMSDNNWLMDNATDVVFQKCCKISGYLPWSLNSEYHTWYN